VIAKVSIGKTFRRLARYLEAGHTGLEYDRVAWRAARNLPTDDSELVAEIMNYEARASARVEKPVYHLAISFDPNDHATPEMMRSAADRVLRDLGLADHQALYVAHHDKAHPHVHIMVNRVHPETGKAWDNANDYARIEQSLRQIEREFGLREVSGRHAQPAGKERAGLTVVTSGELREHARTASLPLVDRVRVQVPALRAAQSWAELESTLSVHGWRLERKGQGLVVTDGDREVKASRVARDLSLRQLETRFNVCYSERNVSPEWVRPVQGRADLSPTQRFLVVKLQQYDRAMRTDHALGAAGMLLDRAEARLRGYEAQQLDTATAIQAWDRSLRDVYRNPHDAKAAFRTFMAQCGESTAIRELSERPETFGALISNMRSNNRVEYDRPDNNMTAHEVARIAARRAEIVVRRERELPNSVIVEAARKSVKHHRTRQEILRAASETFPSRRELAQQIARALSRLSPQDRDTLQRVVSPRQAVLGEALRGAGEIAPQQEKGRDARTRHVQTPRVGAAVHATLRQFAPREFRQINRMMTIAVNPQLAIRQALQAALRTAVRDAVLGREGRG